MDFRKFVACSCALLAFPAGALAQPMAGQGSFEGFDCKMLASMPNAPMTVETCEAKMAAHSNLQQALAQGGGERPGDAALTCQQIAEELKSLKATGVSQANREAATSAGQNLKATQERLQAETAARAARQTGQTAAASVAGSNAAQGAVMYGQMAENKAASSVATAEMGAARDRASGAIANSMNDLAASVRANPRFGRLLLLGGEKNCQM